MLKVARTRNTFSSLGAGEHVQRRRRSAIIYAKSYIQRSTHVRQIVSTVLLERYMPISRKSVQNGNTSDILDLDFAYGFDFVSAFIFGIPNSTNFVGNIKARDYWLGAYLRSHPADYTFLASRAARTDHMVEEGRHIHYSKMVIRSPRRLGTNGRWKWWIKQKMR